jgi:hypothetical protein
LEETVKILRPVPSEPANRTDPESLRVVQSLLALAGVALGIAALWTAPFDAMPSSIFSFEYWHMDRTNAGLALVLLVACATLVLASLALRSELPRVIAACTGAVLVGYFSFVFLWVAPRLSMLNKAAWMGLAGALLIVVGSLPARRRGSRDASRPMPLPRRLPALTALVGLGMGLASIWVATVEYAVNPLRRPGWARPSLWDFVFWWERMMEARPKPSLTGDLPPKTSYEFSYWSFNSFGYKHGLAVGMLALILIAMVSLLFSIRRQRRALSTLALAASLVLLGWVLFYPAVLIDHPQLLGAGAWLGIAGAALATAGLAAVASSVAASATGS